METRKPATVDQYIAQFPEGPQAKLRELRAILKSVAPQARECLKWGKPAFESNMVLFVYSAHKAHLTFAPTGPSLRPFAGELAGYATLKDSVQFPYDGPLPEGLIRKIAAYRKADAEERGARWKY